jgi:hypothetical protein
VRTEFAPSPPAETPRVPGEPVGEARRTVAAYWFRRAEGEMTSWVGFGHVLDDLRALGSPGPVRELAERAVEDEHRHALWCRDWAVHFGHPGGDVVPRSLEPVRFRGATDAQNRLLRVLLCCFTETVGCFILREVRRVVTHPELRQLNQRHLADEIQHSRVGWGHLASVTPRERAWLRGWVPTVLGVLPEACCEGPEEERPELVPFGYFTPSLLTRAHAEAVEQVILPGLSRLGLRESS